MGRLRVLGIYRGAEIFAHMRRLRVEERSIAGFGDAIGVPCAVDLASGSEWACSWLGDRERSLQFHGRSSGQGPRVVFDSAPDATDRGYPDR
jgi:hypothetical protein